MKYTQKERMEIGRKIYTGELSRFEAAELYEIHESTARDYMRMYRDVNHLPPKVPAKMGTNVTMAKTFSQGVGNYASMTKEELVQELIRAKIKEARLKKGYEVKGDGTVILYEKTNTK